MNNNIANFQNKVDNEISPQELILKIKQWWDYLWNKRIIILIVGLLGGALGFIYSLSQKPTYSAKLNFVLEDNKGGGGGIGSIAAITGINLNNGGGGLFQGDNILELYKSRSMLTKTLLTPIKGSNEMLIDRYINMRELHKNWKGGPLEKLDFKESIDGFSLIQDSLIGLFVKDIRSNLLTVRKPDKILSLIEVEVNSYDEVFSKEFTEALVENVTEFYIYTRTHKEKENIAILQHQTDSVRVALNSAIRSVATSLDANPNANTAKRRLNVSSSERQIDVQVNQAILTELVKSLELAKVTLRKESPLIQIIDRPVLPLEKYMFGKVKGIVLGGVLAGFLIVAFFLGLKYLKDIMSI